MAAILISITPLAEYTNIEQIDTVEASAVAVGGATVLTLALLAAGVYMLPDASEEITEEFSEWLSSSGSEEGKTAWESALTSSYVAISPGFISDVASWIGSKFSDLKAGAVSSISSGSPYSFGAVLSDSEKLILNHTKEYINGLGSSYFYHVQTTSDAYRCNYFYTNDDIIFVYNSSQLWAYKHNLETEQLVPQYMRSVCSGGYRYLLMRNNSLGGSSSFSNDYYFGIYDSHYVETTFPFILVPSTTSLGKSMSYSATLMTAIGTYGFSRVENALTSFGDYVQDNMDTLASLTFSSALARNVVDRVRDAIESNSVEDELGKLTYADNIAQIVADVYAAGLADAKAQQGTIEDEKEEAEKDAVTTGWLSNIYDSVIALPNTIFDSFSSTLTDGIGILSDVFQATEDVKELITTIPQTIVQDFTEVFPTADIVTELITGIPASIVNALVDVFPVADDLKEWITTVPADIVDAVSTGVGVIADGLAVTKEAVLAIPAAVVDGITGVLEKLFVPDLTLAEAEIANISNSLGWVTTLNTLINDFMLELEAGEPPTLYLDFTKSEDSKYHGAGRVLAIDFSWYAKYKPTGDLVFSSFLWVVFLWYLFKRVPDIISGAGFITRGSINNDNRSAPKNDSGMVSGSGRYFRHGGGSSL